MTASKVGTSHLKLTVPLHVLPSYFKNRTVPCCDRYEYGLFTAASTLVVRFSQCMQLIGPDQFGEGISLKCSKTFFAVHFILYPCENFFHIFNVSGIDIHLKFTYPYHCYLHVKVLDGCISLHIDVFL